ncbi:MAG: hypothetical protein AB8G17_08500 [Gammaproteobacteria bacterium]
MADPFKMVIFIVLIGGIVQIAKYIRDDRERLRAAREPDEGTTRQIVALEERIKVLEAIVTDDRTQLRREIDSL